MLSTKSRSCASISKAEKEVRKAAAVWITKILGIPWGFFLLFTIFYFYISEGALDSTSFGNCLQARNFQQAWYEPGSKKKKEIGISQNPKKGRKLGLGVGDKGLK